MHSSVLSLKYFHNTEIFMTIMRQSIGARYDHPSEKPLREIFCRISGRLEKVSIRQPGRDRADLSGYKYLPNIAPIGGAGEGIVTGVQCSILPET
jgi:hypothetical protein